MSEKYGNPCATYNIPLNSSENDIFRIGCAHLYHFLHINVKTDDCKPMMLKMHLELDDSPSSIGEAEEQNIEHHNSNNDLRQSVQQLEEEVKSLKDALLQAKEDDVVNRIDKTPDVGNNGTQESNSNKQPNNENMLSGEHNDTENVVSASEEHHTNTMPEEKLEVIDLRENCVYIQNFECFDSSLEKAFRNVRKLANEMNVEIPYDSIIRIDVENKYKYLDYYVYFCNAGIKKEFLRNRHFLIYNPETSPLRIFDHSEWGIVNIVNFHSSDLSLETAYVNVTGIAKKMGMNFIRPYIDHIDVFSTKPNILTYSVRFKGELRRKEFLHKRYLLKQFPETKSLEISDGGGYILVCSDLIDVSTTVASANVIGVAELMGLSLATDDFKRIYVLNHVSGSIRNRAFSLIVDFYSKQVKDEFLEEKHKLEEMEHLKDLIEISDINAKKNIVSIKYKCHEATAISFIGLAKQLGFSVTPDQLQHFFDLSKFIDGACTQRPSLTSDIEIR